MNVIELELAKHLFAGIAEEMGAVLQRASFSPNIRERRDFSCAIFNLQGEMVAQAAHIPVHLGSAPLSVKAVLDAFELEDGQHYVLNDPYCGGTHLPDITLVTPVFWDGEARFLVANRAHHADVGGITPGSMALSQHIDDEGWRIGPTRFDSDVLDSLKAASRTPREREGDMRAQVAANLRGAARLTESFLGGRDLESLASEVLDYTESLGRTLLKRYPEGCWEAEDVLDSDGYNSLDIRLHAEVALKDGAFHVDFSASDDEVLGPMNVPFAVTYSATLYVVRCLLGADVPANDGVARLVKVCTRSGSILDATYPRPVALGNVETSQRVVDLLFRALSKPLEDLVPAASCGSMNSVVIGGIDPRTNEAFTYYETIGGGAGAGPGYPGMSGRHVHMTNTLNTPVEALEHAYPFKVVEYSCRELPKLEAGVQPGGSGVRRAYEFHSPCTVTLMTERRRNAPWSINAPDGERGRNLFVRNGEVRELGDKVTLEVEPGDKIVVLTPGGGHYGLHHE
ncbi:hydantoinase B/oxoprolinase family protein [Microvenator marinus]|uniref:Hydantoinase B/oxoprolinase family protein n=1 Tax=Microvenator marinus TaxID=2600177 RepID=A0A5B8XN17_9DELT|nr:hydantoinase B/oxoprolinase family protein [Microvenator marinus]QED26497.1 hydantoinase B/oxoprolinase family protein [Microvenator marinus]